MTLLSLGRGTCTFSLRNPGLAKHTRILFSWLQCLVGAGTGDTVVKTLPDNAGDTGDAGSIPGLGRSPEEEMASHSSILAWRIPWTKEPDGLHSMGWQRVGHKLIQSGLILRLFQEATGFSSPWTDAHDSPRGN